VRVYTTQGVPVRVYRQKHHPVVSCASWKNYVLVIGNGPALADGTATREGVNLGSTELVYSIENVVNDEMVQTGDTVALPSGGHLKSVFFSEDGDPAIFDTEGVLLVLLHWRKHGQARWVPLLDTHSLAENRQTYWPISIVGDKFQCIILKVLHSS
jgi:chromosome transmission fidelity protein 4